MFVDFKTFQVLFDRGLWLVDLSCIARPIWRAYLHKCVCLASAELLSTCHFSVCLQLMPLRCARDFLMLPSRASCYAALPPLTRQVRAVRSQANQQRMARQALTIAWERFQDKRWTQVRWLVQYWTLLHGFHRQQPVHSHQCLSVLYLCISAALLYRLWVLNRTRLNRVLLNSSREPLARHERAMQARHLPRNRRPIARRRGALTDRRRGEGFRWATTRGAPVRTRFGQPDEPHTLAAPTQTAQAPLIWNQTRFLTISINWKLNFLTHCITAPIKT